MRPFLKWAGGKYDLVDKIKSVIPEKDTLVEPFIGAGSVFLNTEFKSYVLADINKDLISLYKFIQTDVDEFVSLSKSLFLEKNNSENRYIELRASFNKSKDPAWRSVLFLYLNRHGYNGLCRYNLKGMFNIPFGKYSKPYYPEKEIYYFAEKSQQAEFKCQSFLDTFTDLPNNSAVYCDPPYLPNQKSSSSGFTKYSAEGFSMSEQEMLASLAISTSSLHKIPVIISNHATDLSRNLYSKANIIEFDVKRTISSNVKDRNKVAELLAVFL